MLTRYNPPSFLFYHNIVNKSRTKREKSVQKDKKFYRCRSNRSIQIKKDLHPTKGKDLFYIQYMIHSHVFYA